VSNFDEGDVDAVGGGPAHDAGDDEGWVRAHPMILGETAARDGSTNKPQIRLQNCSMGRLCDI
jgi:hypothetical protein